MTEIDQFDFPFDGGKPDRYPNVPGFQNETTSRAAAEAMEPKAGTYRAKCLAVLRRGVPKTADEIAEVLNESILTIRPRVTELYKLGYIDDTGQTRLNESGKAAIVWKVL